MSSASAFINHSQGIFSPLLLLCFHLHPFWSPLGPLCLEIGEKGPGFEVQLLLRVSSDQTPWNKTSFRWPCYPAVVCSTSELLPTVASLLYIPINNVWRRKFLHALSGTNSYFIFHHSGHPVVCASLSNYSFVLASPGLLVMLSNW